MTWYERIIAAHTAVTNAVSHCQRMQSDRYFVWQEDGRDDFISNGKHEERTQEGTTDLFTKLEFDPWADAIEAALEADGAIAWRLNSIQFEEETGFHHYEWVWQVPMGEVEHGEMDDAGAG